MAKSNSAIMLFAGIVLSAVAMFLGIISKLPQGGGGLANNLMVLTLFLQAPPMSPPPTPTRILFDLETAIAENQIFYMKNPVVTVNGTQGPLSRPLRKLPSATSSNNDTTGNGSFAFPTFASPTFSLSLQLTQFWGFLAIAISRIAMVFMALCLPWLVIKYMHLLGHAESPLQAARGPVLVGYGELVAQIEPPNPLLEDLRLVISERNQAFEEVRSISKKARENDKKAAEKDLEIEETLRGLRAERDNALAELDLEKEKGTKLKEKKTEADGLKEEIVSQLKAWQEKEKKWEDDMANDKKRHKEAVDSLNMGRERELESWKREVEGLEQERKGTKEAFTAKLKNILERMKKEREGWGKEKEAWKEEREGGIAEREKMARERKELEEKRDEERRSTEEAVDRAQKRITQLEEQNKMLRDEEAKRQTRSKEVEAARKVAEEEKVRFKEEAQKEAKKMVAKLEEEVLNGRKLIEDLQADKRRDCQLLLELRAQLVRQTHAAPPSHINPLRFGGSAQRFVGPPVIAGPSPSPSTNPTSAIPIVNLPSSSSFPPRAIPQLSPRPTVRLPPRSQPAPAPAPVPVQLPAPTGPPANAPKGPKRSQ